ncbi:WxL domain-containing protein [Oceanobacillus senegalensis]|uniref:WxL domain-containing protein n=1 Tax=Oceanobacillus senegalensis TaxID=1936063 RepID=UPI000A30D77D|nr:WxL domain-containing protein [Oceanobacillus senegalensis]
MKCMRSILIGVASVGLIFALATHVFASSTKTSDVTVSFIEDPTVHQLSLDAVPSIKFGENVLSLKDEVYESTTIEPFVQVTDNRLNAVGWKVEVKASPFTSTSEDIIEGAELRFQNARVIPDSSYKDFAEPTPVTPVRLTTDEVATEVISAEAGAGQGTWKTKWLPASYDPTTPPATNNNVILSVPGGSANQGTYTSTLTWTLKDAP